MATGQIGSSISDQFWRLRARCGPMKAMVAIAHKLLVAAHEVLKHRQLFADLGEQYLSRRSQTNTTRKLVRRLEALGYDVAHTPREVTQLFLGSQLSGNDC